MQSAGCCGWAQGAPMVSLHASSQAKRCIEARNINQSINSQLRCITMRRSREVVYDYVTARGDGLPQVVQLVHGALEGGRRQREGGMGQVRTCAAGEEGRPPMQGRSIGARREAQTETGGHPPVARWWGPCLRPYAAQHSTAKRSTKNQHSAPRTCLRPCAAQLWAPWCLPPSTPAARIESSPAAPGWEGASMLPALAACSSTCTCCEACEAQRTRPPAGRCKPCSHAAAAL